MCVRLKNRNMALMLAMLMSASVALSGCGEEEVVEQDPSLVVEVINPATADLEASGEFMGTVEADNSVTVTAKASGDVTGTFFEVGDTVNAGDVLFTLDDRAAQISMKTAQISAANAAVAVDNANASKSAAEYGMLYTEATIREKVGTMDTDEMRLLNAVTQTKLALQTAQETAELAKEQYGLAADQYDDLEDQIDDLADDARHARKYLNELNAIKENVIRIDNTADGPAAVTYVRDKLGISLSRLNLPATPTKQDVEEAYMMYMTNDAARNQFQLQTMIAAAQQAKSSISAAEESSSSSKDSLRISRFSAAISKETAKNNVLSAEDAKKLAEKALEDYRNFTKATILAGLDQQLASTNLTLIQANNGVTTAQNALKSAQAGVESAELTLENTKGISPVSGVVTAKNIKVNNMANMGTAAYVIETSDGVSVNFYVAESVIKELSVGQRVVLERNKETYQGEIAECNPIADASNGLFKVKVRVSAGSDQLITGTRVKVTMATRHAKGVLTLPVNCVYFEGEKAYVFVKENNTAVKKFVETGLADDKNVEISSGLKADENVISTWTSELKNGSPVRLKDEAEPAGTAPEAETEAPTQTGSADAEQRTPRQVEELTIRTEVGLS